MKTYVTSRIGCLAMLLSAACAPAVVQAQKTTIYRCHSANGGQLIFQDKPCDQLPGTLEAKKGSSGDIIPNAPPAPESDGPPLAERYENYLDAQSARRATEAAAAPRPEPSPAAAAPAGVAGSYGYPVVPVVGTEDGYGYGGYAEGVYPYPAYPPYYNYNREHPHQHNNNNPGNVPAPGYPAKPQALPKPLPLPSSSFPQRPQPVAPPPSPPSQVITRDPNR